MSEEPTWTGRPCPWCGGDGYHNNYLISVGMTACQDCGIELPGEAWDTLSDAAALVRAVKKIEAMMRAPGETDERQLLCDAVGDRIFADIGIVPDGVVLSKVQQRARAATLAAALIALAGEVNE